MSMVRLIRLTLPGVGEHNSEDWHTGDKKQFNNGDDTQYIPFWQYYRFAEFDLGFGEWVYHEIIFVFKIVKKAFADAIFRLAGFDFDRIIDNYLLMCVWFAYL